jgi:catechol 2,3-dioxygenase-like lactoylglutathione lyase family enzyme
MKLFRGRLIDHVHLRVANLQSSQRFYSAVLEVLDIESISDKTHLVADELWIDEGPKSSSIHLGFQANDRATVDRFYKEGLRAGGRDNGAPGERNYHPGYYAAFLFDPDGNNIEVVYHGPAARSTESVEVTIGKRE